MYFTMCTCTWYVHVYTPHSCTCFHTHSLQKRLGEIQDQIAQINREEELFKWTPTTYPQLDQIHGLLEPYLRLFSTVYRWQKAERRFMDGTFLDLNAEDTQAEVSGVSLVYMQLCSSLVLKGYSTCTCAGFSRVLEPQNVPLSHASMYIYMERLISTCTCTGKCAL